MNKTRWKTKDELIGVILQRTHTHGDTSIGQPVKTYIYQLCGHWMQSREFTKNDGLDEKAIK